jgi:5S rRNA maturation endonuclease (ribonuclease M5)
MGKKVAPQMSVAYRNPQSVLQDVHAALEAYGKKPKPIIGDSFTSLCPAHDDSDPSLSITTGDRGIMLHCFAGCNTQSILDAIGFDYSDIFYEHHTPAEDPLRKLATVTPIRSDISTERIDQALRDRLATADDLLAQIEHERCIPRHVLTGAGCGLTHDGRIVLPTYDRDGELAPREWLALAEQRTPGKPKMKGPRGAKPDLWPRPESPRYKDNTNITIVEGEPDALVAVSHHIQACGLPGTNTWQPDDAQRFARFNTVTVLLDDDDAGREASRIITRDLRKAGINTIEQRHTPGAPTRRDLTDLAREHADLTPAIQQLVVIQPDTLYNKALQTIDIDWMLENEPAPREWIWDDYLCRGTLNMLHGAAGLGKSMLGLALAAGCTRIMGTTILGHQIKGCRVAIIDAENSQDEIHRRLRVAGIENRNNITYYRTDITILGQDETRELLEEIAKTADIVILDSQRGLWDGDEKEQAEAGRMLRDLARHAEATGLCILIIHHDTKAGQYSGSSDIDAALSGSRIHIQRANDPKKKLAEDDESWRDRVLTHGKCRVGQEQRPITFRIDISTRIDLVLNTGSTSLLAHENKKIHDWAMSNEVRERFADEWPDLPNAVIKDENGWKDKVRADWDAFRKQTLHNGIYAVQGKNAQRTRFLELDDEKSE